MSSKKHSAPSAFLTPQSSARSDQSFPRYQRPTASTPTTPTSQQQHRPAHARSKPDADESPSVLVDTQQRLAEMSAQLATANERIQGLEMELGMRRSSTGSNADTSTFPAHSTGMEPFLAVLISSLRADLSLKNETISTLKAEVETLAAASNPLQTISAKRMNDTLTNLRQENEYLFEVLNSGHVESLEMQLAHTKASNMALAYKLKETEKMVQQLDSELTRVVVEGVGHRQRQDSGAQVTHNEHEKKF
ncbi:hypothetical protein HDU77_008082 [Chytriomyces hyalinus]|nr:hypothetical protein HDU77_008082 [Chytriomyces hyalinus]